MTATCQHDYEIDSAGDATEAREVAIDARVAELMSEESSPELLSEMFGSGFQYSMAGCICRHIDKAITDTRPESRDTHYMAIGQEIVSLLREYKLYEATKQAEKEIPYEDEDDSD